MTKIYSVLLLLLPCISVVAQDKKELKLIDSYFKEGQYEEAKKLLDKNITQYPKNGDIQFYMGKYYYQKQDNDKARYHLLRALDELPNHVAAKEILASIETTQKHYSSAICYVNELLETRPYDAELWRKKIALYRLQGNDIEANRLLKRIRVIYPQDEQFKKDYLYSLQVQSSQEKKKGNIEEAIKMEQETLRLNPKDEEAYLTLTNTYLLSGDKDKALTYVNRGLQNLPNNQELINRKIGILSEMNRPVEAVEFIQQEMKKGNKSPQMLKNYNDLLAQAALYQNQSDPYVLYGKLYENNPSNAEALDYLINNSLTKGYYTDAAVYIEKGIKSRGRTKDLLSKKYTYLMLSGQDKEAYKVLEELFSKYPNDADIRNNYLQYRYNRGQQLAQQGRYTEAIPDLQWVAAQPSFEWREDAIAALYGAYLNNHQYDKALEQAELLIQQYPQSKGGYLRKAAALSALRQYPQALEIYEKLIGESDAKDNGLYISGYEETALAYIKYLNEKGDATTAYEQQKKLMMLKENSNQGLRYIVATSSLLKKEDEVLSYAQKGKALYPDDFYFVEQEAYAYTRTDRPQEAINALEPYLEKYAYNKDLSKAYAEAAEKQAQKEYKQRDYDQAQHTLLKALQYDPLNKNLQYERGRIFEGQKQYDSAYYYQRQFNPSLVELAEFKRHLNYLKYKTYKNEMQFSYQQNQLKDTKLPGIFTALYHRYQPKNTYTLGLSSSGRADKRAFQGQVGWTHIVNYKWYFDIDAALSNHYFPEYMGNVTLYRALRNEWEAQMGAGYKKLRSADTPQLIQAHLGATKVLDDFSFLVKLTGVSFNNSLYYNTFGRIQYDLLDKRSFLAIFGGVGSAPVDEILNYQLYGQFSTTNANFGGMAEYMLVDKVALSLSGVWYNYYNGVDYSDLYNLIFGINVSF
ncbi:MAG: tetratricopeptide repeat protein [Capnocytophaga gingivalis]